MYLAETRNYKQTKAEKKILQTICIQKKKKKKEKKKKKKEKKERKKILIIVIK